MSKMKKELYRNAEKGKLAGVCAGLAEYFGWEIWLIRVLVVSGVLLGMHWFVVVYIAAWFILDNKSVINTPPRNNDNSSDSLVKGTGKNTSSYKNNANQSSNESIKVKTRIWQSGEPPKKAFHDIRLKYKQLEKQLRSMERYVTSSEFTVSREINRL